MFDSLSEDWWIPVAMNEEGANRYRQDLELQNEELDYGLTQDDIDAVVQDFEDRWDGLAY